MAPSFVPPFSRLVLFWSVLPLVVACVSQLVHGDLGVGNDIEIGSMSESEVTAAAKLSNGDNQEAWWNLAETEWHDSGIQRFFAAGPLLGTEMDKLAEASHKSDKSYSIPKLVHAQKNLTLVFQRLATATYGMNRSVSGTGEIKASMFTLSFTCENSRSCKEGYFAPMVIANSSVSQNENESGKWEPLYASVWLNFTNTLVVNAIPFYIAKLPASSMQATMDANDSELSTVFNVYHNVPTCPATPAEGYRSLLDASYGLVPGVSCVKFDGDHGQSPFKLLVYLSLDLQTVTDNLSDDRQWQSLLDILGQINVTTQWELRPFQECSKEEVLIMYVPEESPNLVLCRKDASGQDKFCISPYSNVSCSNSSEGLNGGGKRLISFLHSITTLSPLCSYDGNPLNHSVLVGLYEAEVSCKMDVSSQSMCNLSIGVYSGDSLPITLVSPPSNWSISEGRNTSEFSQAPRFAGDNNQYTCIRMLSPRFSKTSQAALLKGIQIRARTYLRSFITEHNTAFTTANGQATSLGNFLVLILSTTIAVLVSIPGPFTNFILRTICRIRPFHLDAERGRVRTVVKVMFQMMLNIVLSLCSFLPVLYMAWCERDRQKPFHT